VSWAICCRCNPVIELVSPTNNAEGVAEFQPGVASTPGTSFSKTSNAESVGEWEQLIRELLQSSTLNEELNTWGCANPRLEFANAFGVFNFEAGLS